MEWTKLGAKQLEAIRTDPERWIKRPQFQKMTIPLGQDAGRFLFVEYDIVEKGKLQVYSTRRTSPLVHPEVERRGLAMVPSRVALMFGSQIHQ